MGRVHIIGDSHALTFQGAKDIDCHWMGAATAHNLYKKYDLIASIFKKANDYDKFWFCFGEIDCRLHLYRQHKTHNKTEFSLIMDTTDNYIGAVNRFSDYNIGIMAVPPQGYQDNFYDFEFYASREHRQQLTDVFNFVLENKCLQTNIPFIDIWEQEGLWSEESFREDACHIKNEMATQCLVRYLERSRD